MKAPQITCLEVIFKPDGMYQNTLAKPQSAALIRYIDTLYTGIIKGGSNTSQGKT